jgi:hypothetical protein
MERMALRSTELPVLSQSGVGSEFLSPRSAKSLRETVQAVDHLFGCDCSRRAVALPKVASRVQASICHAQPIRDLASFSVRSPETMLPSSSFSEGRDRWAAKVLEAFVSRGQRSRRALRSGAFVSRVRRLKIRSASSDAARRSFSKGWAEAVKAPDKASGAGSVALREAARAFEQRDPERWRPLSDRRPERKRRKAGPSVQHGRSSGRLRHSEAMLPLEVETSSSGGGLHGPRA